MRVAGFWLFFFLNSLSSLILYLTCFYQKVITFHKLLFGLLSDCLLLPSLSRIFHSHGEVTIVDDSLRT